MLMLLAKAIGSGLVVQSGISCSRVAGVGHKVSQMQVTSVKVKAPCPEVQDEAEAVGDPHMVLTSGQKLDLCCEGGKCEPCNSLHDRNNDEQGRPRHPHHRR